MTMTRAEVRAKLFQSLFKSIFDTKVMIAFAFCIILIASAFMVVVVKYQYKVLLDKEQKLYYQQEDLRDQWTQILIEHSTLASPTNIEHFAEKNNMHLPGVKEIKTIQVDNL
ncbi:cell division protein FtsL [Facilibium subflavum]|uniref:cell division protein FtsL n=1 Tax=Facilibium subflavum TaxID=2219058 RepID=UPI000E6532FC|nr:cell division protein FtsL [Facilibium subflavum]